MKRIPKELSADGSPNLSVFSIPPALFCICIGASLLAAASHSRLAAEEPGKLLLPIPEPVDTLGEQPDMGFLEGLGFEELNKSRIPRKLLIDFLIEDRRIRESPIGLLDFLKPVGEIGRAEVLKENETRRRMFSLIAEQERRTVGEIGREFHQSLTSKKKEEKEEKEEIPQDIEASLTISAPSGIGQRVLPGLVSSYLKTLGYGEVRIFPQGAITRLVGSRSFGSGFIAVEVDTESEEPPANAVVFSLSPYRNALSNSAVALDALAVIVHPDNPVTDLTIPELAEIYTGAADDWNEVGGEDEAAVLPLFPPDRPGLVRQFRELILDSADEFVTAAAGKDSRPWLEKVKSNPGAIAFCLPGEIPSGVKVLRIRATSDSIPLGPSLSNRLALDYPLIRQLEVSASSRVDLFAREFLRHCLSSTGRKSMEAAGFHWSDSVPTANDIEKRKDDKEILLSLSEIPDKYKDLIRDAVRPDVGATLRFDPASDSFELTSYSKASLERLAGFLRENRAEWSELLLIGFGDSSGSASANLTFAKRRADAIAEKFEQLGITRIRTDSLGEEMPVADNGTDSGRWRNQRVEVWMTRR